MQRMLPVIMICAAVPASCLIIDAPTIGVSKMIPAEGDEITWLVPVLNEGEGPFEGAVRVTMRAGRQGDLLSAPVAVEKTLALEPGASEDFSLSWHAPRNGYYRVVFEIDGLDQRVTRRIAVTKSDVYFVWFGAPKEFDWCNVPTTVKSEDREWWLRHGALPAGWKGGVCYKDWPTERFVESWGDTDWIAIDEVGGPGEVTDKFIAAWRQLAEEKPEQFTAVWYMGAHQYWADIKDLVDLFVPEIYLNYRGNHLGQYDTYFRTAREAGVMDQVIPGLGINQIKNKKTGRITNSPTKADVLRQFRYIKRTAPELNGIGFFTSGSAAPGVAEYADQLCEDYYIKPVLTILDPGEPIRLTDEPPPGAKRVAPSPQPGDMLRDEGEARQPLFASVTIRNVGNMDAEDVAIHWTAPSPGQGTQRLTQRVASWPVGEERTFTIDATELAGTLGFRIAPSDGHTLLDGEAERFMVGHERRGGDVFPLIVSRGPEPPLPLPAFVPVTGDGPFSAKGRPVALLPPRPGTKERLAALPMPNPDPHVHRAEYVSRTASAQAHEAPSHSREGNLLTVTTDFYTAALDLAKDEISTLSPAGAGNVLRGPWTLNAAGHEGFGDATVDELPGCLVVTIPYDSEQASGESQYAFFGYTPAIRIARSWIPKGEVTMKGAGDRCGLFQKGGAFALQPGVGGPLRRGRLHDGSQYRDLLFGYLGGGPRPENADKAGWIDFSYGADDTDAGLGVVIDYRWQDSDTKSYDVTRLYDANDWLEVLYLWGKEKTFDRPQRSCIYLIPHRRMDFIDEAVVPPAKALWDNIHATQLKWVAD